MTATTILRPVHAWFAHWEPVVPRHHRVMATGLLALMVAVLLVAAGLPPLVAVGLALPLGIALAIAQEHDQRACLPPDRVFVAALVAAVSPPPLELTVQMVQGQSRTRPEEWDTLVVVSANGAPSHPLARTSVSVTRNASAGCLWLDAADDVPGGSRFLQERLVERGEHGLLERIGRADSPVTDARAIRAALLAAYW